MRKLDLETHSLPFLESQGVRNSGVFCRVWPSSSAYLRSTWGSGYKDSCLSSTPESLTQWSPDSGPRNLNFHKDAWRFWWKALDHDLKSNVFHHPHSVLRVMSTKCSSHPFLPPHPTHVNFEFCMGFHACRPASLLCSRHSRRIPIMELHVWVPSKLQAWLLECLVLSEAL